MAEKKEEDDVIEVTGTVVSYDDLIFEEKEKLVKCRMQCCFGLLFLILIFFLTEYYIIKLSF
jgi:hypothetical protein